MKETDQGSPQKQETPRELGGNTGGSMKRPDDTYWVCLVQGPPESNSQLAAAIPLDYTESLEDAPPATMKSVIGAFPRGFNLCITLPDGTALKISRAKYPSKFTEEDRHRLNVAAATYLNQNPNATRNQVATAIGVADGSVTPLPAWQAVRARRRAMSKMRRAQSGVELDHISADAS